MSLSVRGKGVCEGEGDLPLQSSRGPIHSMQVVVVAAYVHLVCVCMCGACVLVCVCVCVW